MAMNDITGDSLVSRRLSPQGEANFEAIFGKRTRSNRPVHEPIPDGDGIKSGPLPGHGNGTAGEWPHD